MNNNWTKSLMPFLVLIICGAIAAVMLSAKSELLSTENVNPIAAVDVMTVQPGKIEVTIRSRGNVAAKRNIELVSEVSGRVIWMAPEFVAGGQVTKGAPLLRIDPIDYEVALSEARAAVASAKFSLAEVQVVLMRAAIEEAEARVKASQDRLRQAEADLSNTNIAAPFDAIVDIQRIDLGQYVQAGSAVMKLLGTAKAEIRLPLLPSDVPFVRYGQRSDGSWPMATLTARFGSIQHQWEARLVRMEQRVDAQTRVFYVVAEVDHPYDEDQHSQPLSIGLFVEAEMPGLPIEYGTRIPRSALYSGDNVYIFDNDSSRKQQLNVLRREGQYVVVGDDPAPGEKIILSRLDMMIGGTPLSVNN
jgi:RND family efflux transporter MFP subunit